LAYLSGATEKWSRKFGRRQDSGGLSLGRKPEGRGPSLDTEGKREKERLLEKRKGFKKNSALKGGLLKGIEKKKKVPVEGFVKAGEEAREG